MRQKTSRRGQTGGVGDGGAGLPSPRSIAQLEQPVKCEPARICTLQDLAAVARARGHAAIERAALQALAMGGGAR